MFIHSHFISVDQDPHVTIYDLQWVTNPTFGNHWFSASVLWASR